MSLRTVPAGARIERVYFSVPGHGTIGSEFETWNDAVRHAQRALAELVVRLTETLGGWSTPEGIRETANVQVCIDLRWKLVFPGGGGLDTPVERYGDVNRMRLDMDTAECVDTHPGEPVTGGAPLCHKRCGIPVWRHGQRRPAGVEEVRDGSPS